jgi:hypothetical protein
MMVDILEGVWGIASVQCPVIDYPSFNEGDNALGIGLELLLFLVSFKPYFFYLIFIVD